PVAGNIDDIIDAAKYPNIVVVVDFGTVTGQKPAATIFGPVKVLPIGIIETLRVAPYGAGRAGSRTGDNNNALLIGFRRVSIVIHNRHIDAGQRTGTRTGFEGGIGLARGDDC